MSPRNTCVQRSCLSQPKPLTNAAFSEVVPVRERDLKPMGFSLLAAPMAAQRKSPFLSHTAAVPLAAMT